jgi:hypothetical protein
MKARTKRYLISAGSLLVVLLFSGMMGISAWVGKDCREHIQQAKSRYPGTAEDALIAYLQDTRNSIYSRTHLAVWTLGQIRSEKALPLLKSLYQHDPKGESCFGQHDSVLCQYEIHKAIRSIERWSPFAHPRLKEL